jgi:hypothetical protein
MNGGLLGAATVAQPRFTGLLEGGRGQRRRPVAGWEHPGLGPRTLPVRPSQLRHPGGQGHEASLAPFALAHSHQHPL